MKDLKKQYKKPEMSVMEVELEPLLYGSYPTNGPGNGGWYN